VPDLNALAASPFVALIVVMVGIIFLFRLYTRALNSADRAWAVVGELSTALRESNLLVTRSLDVVERQRE
jgi:hypothetical protein